MISEPLRVFSKTFENHFSSISFSLERNVHKHTYSHIYTDKHTYERILRERERASIVVEVGGQ